MKILTVSTLKRRVAPDEFASRSRIIFQLTKGLADKGHAVTLLGTGDSSVPGVEVIPIIPKAWIDLDPVENEYLRQTATLMQLSRKIVELQSNFDVIHNHTYPDFFPFIVENEIQTPMITTLHAVYDYYIDEILSQFPKTKTIALSDSYKNLMKQGKIFKTVYNGVDTSLFSFQKEKSDYLFWLGRLPKGRNKDGTFIDPKGVKTAIQLAQKTGSKLYISGPVEDIEFYKKDVEPYLNEKIQFVGNPTREQSVPFEEILKLYQGASAFLMTVNQEEPFGLVMAEAMSCGTPVIAFNKGAAPEIIKDGKTGFMVPYERGVDGLSEALEKIKTISPEDCRQHIVETFSVEKMVENYEKVYTEIT
ncbi:MAG: glycosyltransferase family 4 protein [Patescibacteria group bacterium]|mgnify:FL=1